MKQETLNKLNLCEDHERECKLANGGLPESIWETYSSFANTNGGTILLGIREHSDSFTIEGLTDKQIIKYQKDFWSTLNDRNKISKNILLNHHVQVIEVEDKKILKIPLTNIPTIIRELIALVLSPPVSPIDTKIGMAPASKKIDAVIIALTFSIFSRSFLFKSIPPS